MNTKQDYLNLQGTEECKKALKALLNRYIWQTIEVVKIAGEDTDSIRYIEDEDVYLKQEYIEDPNAEIFRLGFTVDEVEKMLGE